NFPTQAPLNLGRFTNSTLYFKGSLDEVRIEAGTRSSNWVWASWMTVAGNSALQSYSTVNPQPKLVWTSTGSGLQFTWPASAGVFGLYMATNLTSPGVWQPATNPAVLVNGQWQVLLGTNGPGQVFYRLQQ
ncbi:MAG TPA: hypothetical protein VNT26_08170, partial [Candidatus Sulfotelmatobacter sp.]|nr:hypothetical protein [Candidatus Sulfotelmatobacter sp.]